ncbi:MAG TPA: SUF system NifU family Fe-S cluster assembly protein [Opitutales bacterium]|nr:SUF system NifU family Fe-S cluster assembly protein [Opitutales bacterium]
MQTIGVMLNSTTMDLTDLYQAVILDHNRQPRNFGQMEDPDRTASGDNPSCGDQFSVSIKLKGDVIDEISFYGQGCAISKASGSVMTSIFKGKTEAEAREIFDEFRNLLMTGEFDPNELTEMSAFAGVHQFPARIKCATLTWHAALAALAGDEETVRTEEE